MLERQLEVKFCHQAQCAGLLPLKCTSQNFAGLPDRMILCPHGRVVFVEMKRHGQVMRPLQLHTANKLRALGFPVYVVDSEEAIKEVLYEILGGDVNA